MLKWYKKLYVGATAKKKEKKIIRKINQGAGQLGIYVITLAANEQNNLDIFSSSLLLQKVVRRNCPEIIGIAKGYEEALDIVQEIVSLTYETTGTADVRAFLQADA